MTRMEAERIVSERQAKAKKGVSYIARQTIDGAWWVQGIRAHYNWIAAQ